MTHLRWSTVSLEKGKASSACLLSALLLGAETASATMQADNIRIVKLIVRFGNVNLANTVKF